MNYRIFIIGALAVLFSNCSRSGFLGQEPSELRENIEPAVDYSSTGGTDTDTDTENENENENENEVFETEEMDDSCQNNDECPEACVATECTFFGPAFSACDEDADCVVNARCDDTVCVGTEGYACTTNAQCEGVCRDFACAAPGELLENCDEAADCSGDLVCAGEQCLYAIDESCGGPEECATGLCISSTCSVVGDTQSYCELESHCPSDHQCSDNACLKDLGQSCSDDPECVDQCIGGSCSVSSPEGGACDLSNDCQPALECIGLVCTDVSDPLEALNDEFDDAGSLSDWTERRVLEGQPASDGALSIQGGRLLLQPNVDTYFFNNNRGLGIFKAIDRTVTPNFMVELEVYSYLRDTTSAPTDNYHNSGLAIFPDFASDPRDWSAGVIGRQTGSVGYDIKNTINGASSLNFYYDSDDVPEARIRMCVIGGNVHYYTQNIASSAWVTRDVFSAVMGDEIWVGPMVSDYGAGVADLDGWFDYVHFKSVSSLSACEAL